MTIFAVEYTYDPARTDVQDEVRPRHRSFLADLHDEGVLKASGPLLDVEPGGGLLIVEAASAAHALELLEQDPFYEAGVIVERTVRGWNPVIGPWA